MIRGQEYGVYKGLEQRIRKGLDYKTRGKVWSMGIRIKDRERFGAKSKQKLLDFKPLEENTVNLQYINSIAPLRLVSQY